MRIWFNGILGAVVFMPAMQGIVSASCSNIPKDDGHSTPLSWTADSTRAMAFSDWLVAVDNLNRIQTELNKNRRAAMHKAIDAAPPNADTKAVVSAVTQASELQDTRIVQAKATVVKTESVFKVIAPDVFDLASQKQSDLLKKMVAVRADANSQRFVAYIHYTERDNEGHPWKAFDLDDDDVRCFRWPTAH